MSAKYFVLYLIVATLAFVWVVYQVYATYPHLNTGKLILNLIVAVFFYYLAFKTYHEKKDKELM
ncbi:hypothetical protein JN11_01187 [Mucilaginibacter frigoritolerans]|uniref:Uncharacterized protein n=1 Tax=Mucilaginibacter frigoritolerans TaxID=652788 RepID=A0A562UAD1_9SPHI|nr:hypothetical protein [Mucilaginibacter frigoritolerans]TWJ02215.1 hypothetical protein JN11_01187 [Mucilaginibacter frigoritolerans]